MTQHPDPQIESWLDELGAADRGEPDTAFESRVADAVHSDCDAQPIRGRRRRRAAVPAALGALAALVAVVVVLMPGGSTPSAPGVEASQVSFEDLSFELFDDTFGLSEEISFSSDVDLIDPSSMDEWFETGDAL